VSLKASVILPTYQDWPATARCLDALAAQDLAPSGFEVIVANNNPDDTVPIRLPSGLHVRIVWEPKPGSYAARNSAIQHSRAKIIFFTDADCIPAPHWISRGLQLFENQPGCRRIAGHIVVEPLSGTWNGWSLYDAVFNLRQEHYAQRGYAVTANLAVERSLFEEVGLFREDVFSGEDKEWNRRATALGIPIIYDSTMTVRHPARESLSENAVKARRLAGARFAAKAGRPVARRTPRIHYLLPSPVAARAVWRHCARADAGQRLAAMWCHYRIGWIYNAEIVRLGFFGRMPGRR
jgi:hypothetical protein